LIHKYIKMNRIVKAKHFLKMAKNRRINSHYLLLLEGMILNRESEVNPSARRLLYSALLKSEQTQAIYYIEYLECLFREKRLKKGVYWNRLAMKLFPRNLILMQMYARFWFYSGHTKEAETTLLRVFEHNDGIASVNFNLSLVYARLRQHDASIRYLKLAAFAGFSKKDLLTLNKEFNFVHNHPQFLLALDKILLNYVDFQQKYRFKKI
jgi:tetratricopeptide (TPR) repeat protein